MKIAMLFPGYGSQFVGMGKELYDTSRIMQEYFEEASNCLNMNFVKLCFASSDAEISKLEHALASNFLVSSSLYAILKDQGIKPDIVLGHDAGEYAALYAAGGISFPDMLYLLQKYVAFYQDVLAKVPTKAIRVIGLDGAVIDAVVKSYAQSEEPAYVIIFESATESVVAGHASSVERVREQALQLGAKKVINLPYVDGLHSSLMQPVEEGIRLYSEKVDFKDLLVPLMTGMDATTVTMKDEVKDSVLRNIVSPLHWIDCVKKMVDYDVLIQIGPGTAIADKVRKIYPKKKVVSINKESDIKSLKELVTQSESDESKVTE